MKKETSFEQLKIREFFDKLTNGTVNKTLTQMMMGICIFLLFINCVIPAQEIFLDPTEESPVLIPMLTGILGTGSAYLRVCLYEVYAENQQNRMMTEILQYHPVDIKEVKKMKVFYVFRFLAKLTVVAFVLQFIATYLAYQTISWINVGYIALFVFLVPFFFEVIPMQFRTKI